MTTVQQLLNIKHVDAILHCIRSDATVLEAMRMMTAWKIGALLVMDDGKMKGMLSESDYARKVILQNRKSSTIHVGEIMTTDVLTANPSDPLGDCMEKMLANHIRHLPVLKEGIPITVISIMDVLRSNLLEKNRHPSVEKPSRRQAHIVTQLLAKAKSLHQRSIPSLFDDDSHRAQNWAFSCSRLQIDCSRNRLDNKTLELLIEYARAKRLPQLIKALFTGEHINSSEDKPALHWIFRCGYIPVSRLGDRNIHAFMETQRCALRALEQQVFKGALCGYSGKPLRHILNIGIGGSDIGPRLLHQSLHAHIRNGYSVDFLSNTDPYTLSQLLAKTDPEITLCIISSKSFSTAETLLNAQSVRAWMRSKAGSRDCSQQFWAITSNLEAASAFGIAAQHTFELPEWVGGRYSLWSAIALPTILCCGMDVYLDLLRGGNEMDTHFRQTDLAKNVPALLGMLDVWHRDFCATHTLACIPYDNRLGLLPEYLAQLFMESNGKGIRRTENGIPDSCAPVLWGGVGSNNQHSFSQLLHQGLETHPADFLVGLSPSMEHPEHHAMLFANCLAQTQVLMHGHREEGAPHKDLPGNRPSNLILYDKLDPETLGNLIALYEHRAFTQAMIWDINPFDQWGVEYGKCTANNFLHLLLSSNNGEQGIPEPDASSLRAIKAYQQAQMALDSDPSQNKD
ncbi:MAG: glucose-6-phosphate isomerase [Candidatus Eutrophobiaceae bacterium]